MATPAEAVVFVHQGDRFLVEGYMWLQGEEPHDMLFNVVTIKIVLGLESEPKPMVIERDEAGTMALLHYERMLTSRALAHGGIKTYLIGGPQFDALQAKESSLESSS